MSFNRFRKKTVSERIYEAHNNPSTNNVGNVVRIMTFGITKFYETIDEKAKWNTSNVDHSIGNGFLIINNPNAKPILFNKRYIHEKLLATGTFAQIHLFVDTFMNRKVAVKITKANCELLSWREKAFLDHVTSCEKRGLVLCEFINCLIEYFHFFFFIIRIFCVELVFFSCSSQRYFRP